MKHSYFLLNSVVNSLSHGNYVWNLDFCAKVHGLKHGANSKSCLRFRWI